MSDAAMKKTAKSFCGHVRFVQSAQNLSRRKPMGRPPTHSTHPTGQYGHNQLAEWVQSGRPPRDAPTERRVYLP